MDTDDLFDFLETDSVKRQPEEDDIDDYLLQKRKIIEEKYSDLLPRPSSTLILEAHYEGCTHEVACPPNYTATEDTLNPQYPSEPVKTYPFTLDDFQRLSVGCISQNESVLVAAHTSAGKTVVAEYAIASSLKNNQRVIYTSPIKALSNQKYRDLQQEFTDVGLITGDITINENASCLVMTTEILREMLYRGHDVMREVAWVIFDEIHYLRDKERGVVWEESIILLPDNVRYVFLSATIPNAFEFAQWISHIHKQVCHVVYTDYRPTPLRHYLFPSSGNGIHLVVDEKGKFRDDGFNKALSVLGLDAVGIKSGKKASGADRQDVLKILNMVNKNNLSPVIIFAFSRKELQALSRIARRNDLTNDEEKTLISKILPLLLNGIGIHHSGLLPIIKEIVELLFQEGLVKCLFATETFSMGLNMPAKTVVFTNVRKFDGSQFRFMRPGEYIQMSGRAGRRGKDDQGTTIIMVDEKIEPKILKNLVFGKADPLTSAFYLGYNMLLNLMKLEAADPEGLISKSFRQFQTNNRLPELQKKLKELEENEKTYIFQNEEIVKPLYHMKIAMDKHHSIVHDSIFTEDVLRSFLSDGRLVHIVDPNTLYDFGWAPVIVNKKTNPGKFTAIVALKKGALQPTPTPLSAGGAAGITMFNISSIDKISTLRLSLPDGVRKDPDDFLKKITNVIQNKYPTYNLPLLDPINDLKIQDPSVIDSIDRANSLEKRWNDIKWTNVIKKDYDLFVKRQSIRDEIDVLRGTVVQSKDVILRDELRGMRRVLKRLGYVSEDDIIQVKGRVASELSSGNEIVLTELLFSGLFNSLDTKQTTSILACFVCDEKMDPPELEKDVQERYLEVIKTAKRVATVMSECRLNVDVEKFLEQFKPHLIPVVHQWACGASFDQLTKNTDLFEGSIIRGMKRLDELLQQLVSASKYMGNPELANKFTEGINLIKRDIIFAASLYL
ncbi:Helicase [Entamoeba marina]